MINIIAAIGKNRELGRNNNLLWHIPDDLKYFKKITLNHTVIMGRKTFESIGKPLPDRKNIVISHDRLTISGVVSARSLREAFEISNEECFVVGGAQVYSQALPFVSKLYLTLIDVTVPDADVFFPEYEHLFKKKEVIRQTFKSLHYAYTIWERI